MKKRIFSAFFIFAIALIISITAITTANFYESAKNNAFKQLQNESQLVMQGVENEGISYFDNMTFNDYRITWINNDGVVKYDSSVSSETLENHLDREEVKEAIESGYGEAVRYSSSIMKQSFYVAYKMKDNTIMRLSTTQDSAFSLALSSLYPIYIVLGAAFVLSLALAFFISNQLVKPLNKMNLERPLENKLYPELLPLAKRIDSQRKQLLKDKEETEKNALIRQEFTANVSHELKTPLHAISGYSELIKEGIAKDKDIQNFATRIYDESNRLSKLVEDIMELAKLDNGAKEKEKVKLSLNLVCENVIDSLKVVMEQRHITLHQTLQPCEIIGVPDVIHSLIYNLIDNAIKYNKENGQIDVILKKNNDEEPTLIISDTGIGIPNDQLNRIFERFYRVDKSHSREIGGTGLGLSIVKHAAIIHNAKIEVESTVNQGTIFRIIFKAIH